MIYERRLLGDILTNSLPQCSNSKALDDFGAEAVVELGWCSKAVVYIVPSESFSEELQLASPKMKSDEDFACHMEAPDVDWVLNQAMAQTALDN